jgi:hypothetical protein
VRYLNGGRIGEILVEQYVGKKKKIIERTNYLIEIFSLSNDE